MSTRALLSIVLTPVVAACAVVSAAVLVIGPLQQSSHYVIVASCSIG
jgi:hypothetical protein